MLAVEQGCSCYRPRRIGGRSACLSRMHRGCQPERSQLVIAKGRKGEKDVPRPMDTTVPLGRELTGSKSFSVSLKKMMPANVLSESP